MEERIGPYRIEEQIGAGGMGEVYKAYDDRLERWVAIKRIRSDKDEAEENRERFQREARATAKLSHTSIVHLYDLFRDGENDCIVMEYVEGSSLDTLIKNGPLEPVQAASLGREIANGLAEAHSKGIIHRDLKVENIIVTPQGHAKILDFGLARPLLKDDFDTSLTGKGQLVGTSRAMSPEYVSGEAIDHRSDLFSLGVLIYEMVTSHSPFRAHNTLATLKQVMLHHQTPAHHVNANVPEELSAVIEKLLEKDPEDRPQSAQEVASELGRISGQMSSGDVDRPMVSATFTTTPTEVYTPTATSIDLRRRRRWLMTAAGALVVGLLATYGVTRWPGAAPDIPVEETTGNRPVKERDQIVLADFQNHTRELVFDDSLALVFRLGLEQSHVYSVLSSSQVREVLHRMERGADTPVDRELGIEIGQREGSRALVIGAISKIGKTYSLSAEIVDPHDGASRFATQENAKTQDEIVTALDTVTKAIRVNLGESVAAVEESQRPLEKVTTKKLEALKAYSLGVAKVLEGRDEEAIPLLERALAIDPEFAMAHAKLATVHHNLRLDRAKTLAHLDEAARLSERLTKIEQLYVEGWVARLNGDPEAVIDTWSYMSTAYPDEFNGHYNLGMAYSTYLQRYEDAARAFKAAVEVAAPEDLTLGLIRLAYCQIALGRYDDALVSLEGASGAEKQLALADLYIVQERYPDARQLIEEVLKKPLRILQLQGRLRMAELHLGQGSFEEAAEEANEAATLAIEEGAMQLSLASQLTWAAAAKHTAGHSFRSILASATQTAKELMEANRETSDLSSVLMLALVGKLNARSGEVPVAESIASLLSALKEAASETVSHSYALMLEGEILAAKGDHEGAVTRFEQGIAIAESFQLHESLAQAYEATGLVAEAVREYEWIVGHRGEGLVECLDQCHGLNLADWSLAWERVGGLYERLGEREKARVSYERFLDVWRGSEASATVEQARRRIEDLRRQPQ